MKLLSNERNAFRIVFAQRGKSLAGILENGVPVFSRADRKALVALVIVLDVYISLDVPLSGDIVLHTGIRHPVDLAIENKHGGKDEDGKDRHF